jgi:hypothetical protein
MRNMLKVTLVFAMLITTVFAQARITGDVRVRPRMDTSEDGSGELHNKIICCEKKFHYYLLLSL